MKVTTKIQGHQIQLLSHISGIQYGHCESQQKSVIFCGVPAMNPSQPARTYIIAISKLIHDVLAVTTQLRALHALWQCNSLDEIWLAVPWGSLLKANQYLDFMELMHCCIRLLSISDLQLFAVITWSIWYQRNCLWQDQPTDTNDQLVHRAQRLLWDFLEAQENPNLPTRNTNPQTESYMEATAAREI
jgi:hypothetical protein